MITIELKLYVTLAEFLPKTGEKYETREDQTIAELISELNIPPDEIKLIFVNGRRQDLNYKIQADDRVGLSRRWAADREIACRNLKIDTIEILIRSPGRNRKNLVVQRW